MAYKLNKTHAGHAAGTTVVLWGKGDRTRSADMTVETGVSHVSVAVDGDTGPFFTIPVSDLEEV